MDQVRRLLLPRSDGKPGMKVAKNVPEMEHVIAGFQGGYIYRRVREGQTEKETPHKDGFYDHIFDAFQYLVDHAAPVQPAMRGDEPNQDWWKDKELGVGVDSRRIRVRTTRGATYDLTFPVICPYPFREWLDCPAWRTG